MNEKQTDRLMNTLSRLSTVVIIPGAFLRISHYSIVHLQKRNNSSQVYLAAREI